MLKTLGIGVFDDLRLRALATPRRRMNHNLHTNLDDPIQRFCNALEPGTYLPPHRHSGTHRWELLAILRGHVALLIFDDAGSVTQRVELTPGGSNCALEIPGGTWHALTSLASGSVILEVKHGPYIRAEGENLAVWAPQEGEPCANDFERWMRMAQAGDRAPKLTSIDEDKTCNPN